MPTDSTWEERRAESRTSGTPVLKGWEEKAPRKRGLSRSGQEKTQTVEGIEKAVSNAKRMAGD